MDYGDMQTFNLFFICGACAWLLQVEQKVAEGFFSKCQGSNKERGWGDSCNTQRVIHTTNGIWWRSQKREGWSCNKLCHSSRMIILVMTTREPMENYLMHLSRLGKLVLTSSRSKHLTLVIIDSSSKCWVFFGRSKLFRKHWLSCTKTGNMMPILDLYLPVGMAIFCKYGWLEFSLLFFKGLFCFSSLLQTCVQLHWWCWIGCNLFYLTHELRKKIEGKGSLIYPWNLTEYPSPCEWGKNKEFGRCWFFNIILCFYMLLLTFFFLVRTWVV